MSAPSVRGFLATGIRLMDVGHFTAVECNSLYRAEACSTANTNAVATKQLTLNLLGIAATQVYGKGRANEKILHLI